MSGGFRFSGTSKSFSRLNLIKSSYFRKEICRLCLFSLAWTHTQEIK